MVLSNLSSGAPLYKEVRRRILEALARGEWRAGERLPNEADLAKRFGVAVSTIRAGVRELTAAGILVRRQGKGTFVARHDFERQQFRFSNVYGSDQKKVVTRRHITAIKRVAADRATRLLLQLDGTGSADVHQISAILKVGEEPVAVMELVLPAAKFPGLRQKDLEQNSENLYSVYQRVFGITVVRMEEKVFAKTATAALARKLNVQAGHPILCVERIAFSFNDIPMEIRRRLYEGSQHYYLFVHERLD
jgi:GntR family transcriptional regulator